MKRRKLSRILHTMQRVYIVMVMVPLSFLAIAYLKSDSNSQNGFDLCLLAFSFISFGDSGSVPLVSYRYYAKVRQYAKVIAKALDVPVIDLSNEQSNRREAAKENHHPIRLSWPALFTDPDEPGGGLELRLKTRGQWCIVKSRMKAYKLELLSRR